MQLFDESQKKSRYVIVNIWTSAENKAIPGSNVGHVSLQTQDGYMSLWPGKFVRKERSIGQLEKYFLRYFGERPAEFKLNYEEDCALEALSEERAREIKDIGECRQGEVPYLLNAENGHATVLREQPKNIEENCFLLAVRPIIANVRIVLYLLRKDRLESKFAEMARRTNHWRLVGSNIISRLSENSPQSCSSLAYELLGAGGLYEKLEGHGSSENSSVVTPDDLVKHVVTYKQTELRKFPKSIEWFRTDCQDESNVETLQKTLNDEKKSNSIFDMFKKTA